MQSLRSVALAYPEAEEGVACQGTALECSAFKVRNKTFLFLGDAHLMVKLRESLEEATKMNGCQVGAHGWVKVTFSAGQSFPPCLLERWLDESYRLIAPKQLVAMLTEERPAPPAKTPKKKRPKK